MITISEFELKRQLNKHFLKGLLIGEIIGGLVAIIIVNSMWMFFK